MNNLVHHYFCFISSEHFCSTRDIFSTYHQVKSGPPCNAANYLCPAYQQGWNPHCQLGSEWSPQIPGYCQLSGVTLGNSSDVQVLQESGTEWRGQEVHWRLMTEIGKRGPSRTGQRKPTDHIAVSQNLSQHNRSSRARIAHNKRWC